MLIEAINQAAAQSQPAWTAALLKPLGVLDELGVAPAQIMIAANWGLTGLLAWGVAGVLSIARMWLRAARPSRASG